MLPIAPILLVLLCADVAVANVAMPVIEGDPGYERARLANTYGFPAFILGLIAMGLFWKWVARRTDSSLGCVVGGAMMVLAVLFAFAVVTTRGPVAFQPAPVPGDSIIIMVGYDRNNRPLTPAETALLGLVLAFVASVAGFLLLRFIRKRPAADSPAAQA